VDDICDCRSIKIEKFQEEEKRVVQVALVSSVTVLEAGLLYINQICKFGPTCPCKVFKALSYVESRRIGTRPIM